MARLGDAQMREILETVFPAGEVVRHCAYGVRQPNMLLLLPAFALAILPGVILAQILTKHFIVGLGETHLAIVQVSPKWTTLALAVSGVKASRLVALGDLAGQPVRVKAGAIFVTIEFGAGDTGFKAKFHRAFSKINRAEAQAIGEAITAAARPR